MVEYVGEGKFLMIITIFSNRQQDGYIYTCIFLTVFSPLLNLIFSVIDDKTCEERLWKMKHCGDTNFYLCEISRDMVIDATFKGNKSRFINHSCQPNTEMQKWLSSILCHRINKTGNCFS